jgi:serine/threonine protein kinase/lipopolysaccharide biosynthesis regulator YciM
MPLTPNQVIQIRELGQIRDSDSDRFRIVEVIPGGMGICLKIRNEASGNDYALKTIRTAFAEESRIWTMFIEEMKTWLTLSACDGIVEAYCIAKINEQPYVCAEWLSGGNLRGLMTETNVGSFYRNTIRIVRSLEWANTHHRIIHRDIKPENILLNDARLAFITDWGIARPITKSKEISSSALKDISQRRPELTAAGEFLGTISYASPEQILGLKDIDHRSDIYSLGCVLYEWEVGRPPFIGATANEIAYNHLNKNASRIGGNFRRSTFGAEKVIEKCLEKDRNKRFQDYASFANALLDASQKRDARFSVYVPGIRPATSPIGEEEFRKRVRSGELAQNRSKDGLYSLIEFDDLAPYIREAEALVAIGEWQKALDIYGSLFIPELPLIEGSHQQAVAINYANCLIQTGKAAQAVSVLQSLGDRRSRSAEYFVNLSLAHLHLHEPDRAEEVAKEGLSIYPDDNEICGNLLISQTYQHKYAQALETATLRLNLGRDVHSLQEVGNLLKRIGDERVEKNLPEAAERYGEALSLLTEAKQLNPRFVTARLNRAGVLCELQQYPEAITELSEIARLPQHESVLLAAVSLWARCLDQMALHKECVEFCDKWLKENPDSIQLERVRAETIVDGFCIGREKDGTRVVERSSLQFFESIINQPGQRQVSDFCYLARLYEWMDQAEDAKSLLSQAESLAPDYWEIPFDRASFELRSGELKNALSNASTATQIAPWRPQTWRLLAAIYGALNMAAQAENAAREAEFRDQQRSELFNRTAKI